MQMDSLSIWDNIFTKFQNSAAVSNGGFCAQELWTSQEAWPVAVVMWNKCEISQLSMLKLRNTHEQTKYNAGSTA